MKRVDYFFKGIKIDPNEKFISNEKIVSVNNSEIKEEINQIKNNLFPIINPVKVITLKSGEYHLTQIIDKDKTFKNIRIIIKENSKVKLYDFTKSTYSDKNMHFSNIEIIIEKESKVYYLKIDEFKNETIYSNTEIEVEENAQVDVDLIGFNQGKTFNNFKINLRGKHAVGNFKAIAIANQGTENLYEVAINNYAPLTKGDIWQKAVATNKGSNQLFTTGFIAPKCSKAENYQESRVLLLDDAANGDVSPILLIEHHDVLAGHAAGVSRVNSDELYYLMSRGITKHEAEKLITLAFVRPLIDSLPTEELQESTLLKVNSFLNN